MRVWDAMWGRGEFSVTVPSMDGALRPNTRLDEAALVAEAPAVDDLAVSEGHLFFSRGSDLWTMERAGDAPGPVRSFPAVITGLAASRHGDLAIALDNGEIHLLAADKDGAAQTIVLPGGSTSATALAFARDGALLVCVGSAVNKASQWRRDLMMRGATGSVLKLASPKGSFETIQAGLAFPSGVTVDGADSVVVSEAWHHRLVRLRANGRPEPVLADIPGYPGRIAPAAGGGYWLSVFAPRSQMIEFVLREKVYRERMVAEVPEDYWMAPTLRAGVSFKEPLQGGGVKHLGIQKPWGPTRSYGLVVRLDANFKPVESCHSRSDGHRHGVTSVVDWNGDTIVASKGDGALVKLAARAVKS